MTITKESIGELETVLSRYENDMGQIDLDSLVTTNCQCKGAHCSTGCSGNKGQFWPEPAKSPVALGVLP